MSRMILCFVALTAACSEIQLASVTVARNEPRNTLFRDVSVFDGKSMLRHQDVLVVGSKVKAVAPVGEVNAVEATREIAGEGKTLLPGLVDSHAHLFSAGGEGSTPSLARGDRPCIPLRGGDDDPGGGGLRRSPGAQAEKRRRRSSGAPSVYIGTGPHGSGRTPDPSFASHAAPAAGPADG